MFPVRLLVFGIVLASTVVCSWVIAGNDFLQRLDDVLVEYKIENLDQFLANKEFQETYFKALQDYYGQEKFPRQSYDAIFMQLRDVSQKVPAINERLFETNDLGKAFTIRTELKTSGLELKADAWNKFQERWIGDLKTQAGEYLLLKEEKSRKKKVEADIRRFEKQMAEIEFELGKLSKKAQAERRPQLVKTLKEDPVFRKLASYVVLQKVSQESVKALFKMNDADLVLETMAGFRRRGGLSLDKGQVHVPENLHALFAESAVPGFEQPPLQVIDGKPAESDLFRVIVKKTNRGVLVPIGRGGKTEYFFRPIPRRIHGIWKGVALGECVGGNSEALGRLSPERWATVAIQGSRLFQLEREGKYLGFVQEVPGTIEGKKYYSVDFGAPDLLRSIVIQDSRTGELKSVPFYVEWLKKARKNLPPGSKGFVVGNSSAIGNAGVIQKVQEDLLYLMGQPVAVGKGQFQFQDALAKDIVGVSPADNPYGGSMVVDATVPQTTRLTKLVAVGGGAADSSALLQAWPKLKREPKIALLNYYEKNKRLDGLWPKMAEILQDRDERVRAYAFLILSRNKYWPKDFWSQIPTLLRDQNERVRSAVVNMLEDQKDWPKEFWAELPMLLRDQNEKVRSTVMNMLSGRKDWPKETWAKFATLLRDQSETVRAAVVKQLQDRKHWPKEFWAEVPILLQDQNPEVRFAVLRLLESQNNWAKEVWELIPTLLRDQDARVRSWVFILLQKQQILLNRKDYPKEVLSVIHLLMRDPNENVRVAAVNVLVDQKDWPKEAWSEIPGLLSSGSNNVRYRVLLALKNQKDWSPEVKQWFSKKGNRAKLEKISDASFSEELKKAVGEVLSQGQTLDPHSNPNYLGIDSNIEKARSPQKAEYSSAGQNVVKSAGKLYLAEILAELAGEGGADGALASFGCLFTPQKHLGLAAMMGTMAAGQSGNRAFNSQLSPQAAKVGLFLGNFVVDVAAFQTADAVRACYHSNAQGGVKACADAAVKQLASVESMAGSSRGAAELGIARVGVKFSAQSVLRGAVQGLELMNKTRKTAKVTEALRKLRTVFGAVKSGQGLTGLPGIASLTAEFVVMNELEQLYQEHEIESQKKELREKIHQLAQKLTDPRTPPKYFSQQLDAFVEARRDLQSLEELSILRDQAPVLKKLALQQTFLQWFDEFLKMPLCSSEWKSWENYVDKMKLGTMPESMKKTFENSLYWINAKIVQGVEGEAVRAFRSAQRVKEEYRMCDSSCSTLAVEIPADREMPAELSQPTCYDGRSSDLWPVGLGAEIETVVCSDQTMSAQAVLDQENQERLAPMVPQLEKAQSEVLGKRGTVLDLLENETQVLKSLQGQFTDLKDKASWKELKLQAIAERLKNTDEEKNGFIQQTVYQKAQDYFLKHPEKLPSPGSCP